ncbi:hypothetical protein [uncultured Desulfuromonas sp.]|uniref:hypothetical protein n=1 Tax=uncultured Desulfuromonas sp. TaxID=181013 RepID=UPI002AAB4215|nr:hypothetical protein [uncultured Desulfuromonas sp.]
MTYADLRIRAVTGDVLAVKGTGIAGRIIRALTGESYSHVALLVQETSGLFAYEFVEGTGFQILPASEWVRRRQKQNLRFCRAPERVLNNPNAVAAAARCYRNSSVVSRWYGWLSLVKVWLSQKTGLKIPVRQKVCSTFVQECWAATGYTLPTTADPGEIVNACDPIHTITPEEQ